MCASRLSPKMASTIAYIFPGGSKDSSSLIVYEREDR